MPISQNAQGMESIMKLWQLRTGLILPIFFTAAAAAAAPTPNSMVHLFDYDSHQSLDFHDQTLKDFSCGVIHDITYASPSGGSISAYLIVPKGHGPFAAIVFGHWGNGTRGEFIPEAKADACAGAVSLLPDYSWERPRPWYSAIDDIAHPDLDRKTRINTVIEMRRAIDLLLTRSDVDPKRIGYVGHSFGAQWGAILAAIDPRIKVAVLMAGAAEEADTLLRSDNPQIANFRASLPKGQLEMYLKTIEDLNAINYVRYAQLPLLLQFANFEQYFDRASMVRYAGAATEPKTVLFYDSAHDLNDPQAFKDRFDWLNIPLAFR
jgi:cephalosporin-C deacetylase-like acetyl esterase